VLKYNLNTLNIKKIMVIKILKNRNLLFPILNLIKYHIFITNYY